MDVHAIDHISEALARQHAKEGMAQRLSLPDAWKTLFFIAVARLDEAFALIDAGMQAAQRDGISANIRVWSMMRFRALFCSGRLADARAEAEATIEMADEMGDGSYGYVNHVALYVLGRVALHTGDPAGLAQARRTAARLGQARESPASQRLGAWLMALVAEADGALATQAGVQVLDPLASGALSATSPRMYADSAALTRILLDAGRRADAESVVARLEDFAALHPDFPFIDCAAEHARAVSLVAQGATNREVAERLYLSPYTVNSHLRHVFAKLGIRSRVELARLAAARGMSADRGSSG